MGKLGLNSGYIGSDQRITTVGTVGYDKYFLERKAGRFNPILGNVNLLDLYTEALAAYSVRKLRTLYTGNAIRVRRSSDNTEQDIGFDGAGNLDILTLISFCSGTNGFITTWYDQSLNGLNVTQSTAANQPQIVSSGSVLMLNSKPTAKFIKANNHNLKNIPFSISGATTFSLVGSVTLPVSNWTYVFGIGTYSSNAGYQFTPSTYVTTNDWNAGDLALVGNGYSSGQAPRLVSNGAQYTSDTQALTLGILSTSNAKVYKNNSLISQRVGLVGSVPLNSTLLIGTNNFNESLEGNVQELVFWNTDQTSNVNGINLNINNYYATY